MPYNEKLAKGVREILSVVPRVVEKQMFGGLAFMVNGKMCVTVGKERIMCRVDPTLHDELVRREGCQPVTMRGESTGDTSESARAFWEHEKILTIGLGSPLTSTRGPRIPRKRSGSNR